MLELQGDRLPAGRPAAGGLEGGAARAALPGGHRAGSSRSAASELQGSVEIARELDRLVPEPPLLPADPAAARKPSSKPSGSVTSELQHPLRQIIWWLLKRDRDAAAQLPRRARRSAYRKGWRSRPPRPLVAASVHFNKAGDENVRRRRSRRCRRMLDRADGYIADGRSAASSPTPPTSRSPPPSDWR